MKKSKGFTLIEMMIVIAMIGILTAVVVPACSQKGITSSTGEIISSSDGCN